MVEFVEQSSARKTAVQRRGLARRKAILDAAEELLGAEGYESATLKAISDRTGIPPASMYHYFADRHQVEVELLQGHLRDLDTRIAANLDLPRDLTLRDAVSVVIDTMLAYFREYPSCIELWFAGRHQKLTQLVQTFDDAKAEQLWHLLIREELLLADTPLLVVQLAFEADSRLFDVAFRHSRTGDEATIEESRRLVTAYLATYGSRA
ncbi:TetR/AcrR family transcriptional regulator [Nocardia sp. CA-119907]|uniref:TetR/AcrR family transcriptional regulator n=1 Tax=Nocardia sp. CA-119907 TaxID=3239973 RepID=UPI003D978414